MQIIQKKFSKSAFKAGMLRKLLKYFQNGPKALKLIS